MAEECMRQAVAAARAAETKGGQAEEEGGRMSEEEISFEYRIDAVPCAVGFWRRLGFEEVEASGEQLYFMRRGGDRPMVKRL